ncbi:alpha-1-acid glycoprotein 1 [Physeter macrocephalus]|uniref:Alpha-1-acid glycoprotein 1 n=1 Tax=Physeter macrocephalus TaxID=9755 RepID=A0A2Y9EVJ4_PHYMC|nr:alpha-1-acid glycoprotein-like [Physeter catodon]|eukprot:XP_007109534.1 alpha-1-acid glycoprotein-like [Physeter catodon]
MVLPWTLAVLSLLPLLDAQSLECANLTAVAPITNATLDRLSGKWFYIGSAFRNPEYNESARSIQAAFFYFEPKHAEDKIILREYQTIGNKCIYNSSSVTVYRKNGTMSTYESGREYFADLLLTKHPKTFILSASWNGKKNVGMSFYADKPEVTQEQKKEFLDAIKCIGIHESEITYSDEKKDLCGPLHMQHEEERKKEKEGS